MSNAVRFAAARVSRSAQVVDPPLRDVGEERERHVHLLGRRPPEVGRLAAYVEELVEVLDRVVRRLDRDEHPAHFWPVSASDPPSPIIMMPPVPCMRASRRGLLLNQLRAVPAA